MILSADLTYYITIQNEGINTFHGFMLVYLHINCPE
jgi:hypothetical protein